MLTLPAGDNVPVLLAIAGGLAVLFLLIAVFGRSSSETRMRQRMSGLQRQFLVMSDDMPLQGGVRRDDSYSRSKTIDRLIRQLMPKPAKMRARLAATGRKITLARYLFICLLTGIGAMLAGHFLLDRNWLISALGGFGVGILLPHGIVGWLIKRRLDRFNELFPEAIDLVVRGLRSGLPVQESMKTIGQEIADPVGQEFRLITDGIKLGQQLEELLWDTATRIDIAEFKFFVVSISVQRETGGNLSETLANLSEILRRRKQMRLKIKAMSSEARASAYIIGSLPFILFGILLMINPGYALTLFSDPRGIAMATTGLGCMAMGCAVMMKMVKFEI